MSSQELLCPYCGAKGKDGKIRVHSQTPKRYRCQDCRRTFSERCGTALYHLKKVELFSAAVALLAYGCPPQAIVAAYGVSEKTVRDWAKRAGTHCERVHEATVMSQHWDLQHIQADELKITTQLGVVWVALVMMVSNRLWLGG